MPIPFKMGCTLFGSCERDEQIWLYAIRVAMFHVPATRHVYAGYGDTGLDLLQGIEDRSKLRTGWRLWIMGNELIELILRSCTGRWQMGSQAGRLCTEVTTFDLGI